MPFERAVLKQLQSRALSRTLRAAGLVFYDLDDGPAAAFQRMSVMYFTMLLFELLPFCYMSFYVWDRKFFLSDRASDLYSTSAYYMAHMAASESLSTSLAKIRHALFNMSVPWRPILSSTVGNPDSSWYRSQAGSSKEISELPGVSQRDLGSIYCRGNSVTCLYAFPCDYL
jgi:hypothetical protein